jgi:hypothetical protein
MNSINAAINNIVKNKIDPIKKGGRYSVQSAQRLRDELYTLIPTAATGAPSGNVVPYPANYLYFLMLHIIVDGERQLVSPTDYNREGVLFEDPFTEPAIDNVYCNEIITGFRIIYGSSGTLGNYELYYVKNPAVVSIGQEKHKIIAGGSIVNGTVYYVYEECVYNAVTYYPGDTFTGGATSTLTSGIVIATTNITNCDLPGNMHEEVCEFAAMLLSSDVEDWNKKQSLNVDVERE